MRMKEEMYEALGVVVVATKKVHLDDVQVKDVGKMCSYQNSTHRGGY